MEAGSTPETTTTMVVVALRTLMISLENRTAIPRGRSHTK